MVRINSSHPLKKEWKYLQWNSSTFLSLFQTNIYFKAKTYRLCQGIRGDYREGGDLLLFILGCFVYLRRMLKQQQNLAHTETCTVPARARYPGVWQFFLFLVSGEWGLGRRQGPFTSCLGPGLWIYKNDYVIEWGMYTLYWMLDIKEMVMGLCNLTRSMRIITQVALKACWVEKSNCLRTNNKQEVTLYQAHVKRQIQYCAMATNWIMWQLPRASRRTAFKIYSL